MDIGSCRGKIFGRHWMGVMLFLLLLLVYVLTGCGQRIRQADRETVGESGRGKGSIMMNCQELATLAEEGLPVKVLVLNNRGLGMVRQWQRMFYARRMSASKHEFKLSFARLGEAMGCLGLTVQEPAVLARALQQAAAY